MGSIRRLGMIAVVASLRARTTPSEAGRRTWQPGTSVMVAGRTAVIVMAALVSTLVIPAAPAGARSPGETASAEPVVAWTRQFGTTRDDYARAIAVGASGATAVAGSTMGRFPGQSKAGGVWDAFVRTLSPSGAVRWTDQFGSASGTDAYGVAIGPSGAVYVVGYTEGRLPGQTTSGGGDAFVRKYAPRGALRWTRQFGTRSNEEASAIAINDSGVVVVAGSTQGRFPGQRSAGDYDVFVRVYGPSGALRWTRQFGSSWPDHAYGVAVDTSGAVYVVGYTEGTLPGQTARGDEDAFVRKFAPRGAVRWTRQFGTQSADTASGVAVDASGVVSVAGHTQFDAFVRTFGPSGATRWADVFGTTKAFDGARAVAVHASGAISVAGLLKEGALTDADAFARTYGPSGAVRWTRRFGSTRDDEAMGIAVGPAGAVYVAGVTSGALAGQTVVGGRDAFVRKYVRE